MSTKQLFRMSGLSLILGGVFLFIHFATHPMGEGAQFVAMPLWSLSHAIGFIAWPLLLLGMIGLYAQQADRLGMLGLISFVLIFISGIDFGGGQLIGAAIQPIYPHFGDPGGLAYTSPAVKLILSFGELWLLGFLVFAILSLRTRTFPRLGGWLTILAVIIGVAAALLPFGSTTSYYLADLATAILATGLCLWGYALWSGRYEGHGIVEAKVKQTVTP
jgi:hypothetical protein